MSISNHRQVFGRFRPVSVVDLARIERRPYPGWRRTFEKVCSWLRKSSTVVDSAIFDCFRNLPSHFHIKLPAGTSLEIDDVHWIILGITGCEWVTTMTRHLDASNPRHGLRLGACHCPDPRSIAAAASYRLGEEYHINVSLACLQTARALMLPDMASLASPDAYVNELDAIVSNLVDSSLLQNCVFGPELISICRTLFSSTEIWGSFSKARSGLTRLGRREKLSKWFETFPNDYPEEVGSLRAEFESIFSDDARAEASGGVDTDSESISSVTPLRTW
ncbi:hypothetical protein V5O48_017813 [Marasmius crinis-equi]|uniref:Uncharacterized protein n=1 Tax=Marasmius crinis-equi TaxID=585013 RepID=A0ABR3EMY4_9AGAR